MNKVRNFCFAVIAILVLIVLVMTISVITKKPQPAIDFDAVSYNGTEFKLSDNFKKCGTVLIFIDPEIAGSNEVLSKLMARKDKIDIIAVSVSKLPEAEQKKLLPSGYESLEKLCFEGSQAIEKYKIGNAPITYFIDKEGYVRDVFPANVREKTIDKLIEKLK